MLPLDQLWAQIFSSDPAQIRQAWDSLSPEEQSHVRDHLRRMQSEPGWHPSQQASAQAALQALETLEPRP
jgi:hypothetical protein